MDGIRNMLSMLVDEGEELFANGLDNVDMNAAGMLCDMIKDLTEAERNCAELKIEHVPASHERMRMKDKPDDERREKAKRELQSLISEL